MTRSVVVAGHRRRAVLALLAALVLRAFVPAGFMPAVRAGSLALVFCGPGAAASGPHAHHLGHAAGSGHALRAGDCPFAQSASPVLPSVATPCGTSPRVAAVLRADRPAAPAPGVPLRYAAPRGPPA
jgi:hypothetical protein